MTYITLTDFQHLRSVSQSVSVRTEKKMSSKISYSDCVKNGTWVGTFVSGDGQVQLNSGNSELSYLVQLPVMREPEPAREERREEFLPVLQTIRLRTAGPPPT